MTPNMIVTSAEMRHAAYSAEAVAARRARQCRQPGSARFMLVTSSRLWLGSQLIALGTFVQRRSDVVLAAESGLSDSR